MLIPLVSVAVVLTLLPALLSRIGPRVDCPRIRQRRWPPAVGRRGPDHRAPTFVAAGIAAWPLPLVIAPVAGLKIGESGTSSLARSWSAFTVLQQLKAGGVDNGILTPIEVLVYPGQGRRLGPAPPRRWPVMLGGPPEAAPRTG